VQGCMSTQVTNYSNVNSLNYLQERLNQVLMEKKKESRSGMEIMNLLQVLIHVVHCFNVI
jgi:hypothetical protein